MTRTTRMGKGKTRGANDAGDAGDANGPNGPEKTETERVADARETLLDAVLPNVAFDGWSAKALAAATEESGIDPGLARLAFPHGGVDMALAFHYRADRRLVEALETPEEAASLASMRIRDRIAHAVLRRIDLIADDREAVRRGAALLGLPVHAGEGLKAVWHTADAIWTACGDASDDYNWYTKRAILSAVYSTTVLFWLGDRSPGFEKTRGFVDRRIENVMSFEKAKAAMREPGRILARAMGRAKPGRTQT